MGWWPFSNSGVDAKVQETAAQQPPSIPPLPSQSPPPPTSAPHDPDFYAAHPHLAPPSLSAPSTTQPTTSPSSDDSSQPSNDLDPHLPITMSCRATFDAAFYCSSLGGHFNDIYRYGQLRDCSEHWSDFWFCMRTKNSYGPVDTKHRMIQDRYREKEEKLRAGPSSEDFWRIRGPGEEVRDAFGKKRAGGGD